MSTVLGQHHEPTIVIATNRDTLEHGYYTVAQAATRLGVTERTANRWITAGTFPVPITILGARRRIGIAVLERYIDPEWTNPAVAS